MNCDLNMLSIIGNLYEMLRRCLGLPISHAVVPNLPLIWLQRGDLIRNTFRNFPIDFINLS